MSIEEALLVALTASEPRFPVVPDGDVNVLELEAPPRVVGGVGVLLGGG